MDLLITGVTEPQGFVTRVLRNDEGEFSTLSQDLPGLLFSSGAWGDYDADGDLDILVSGADLSPFILEGRRMILRNDGGHFVLADDIGEGAVGSGRWGGAVGWGDFTNSGGLDLDLLVWGESAVRILRNRKQEGGERPSIPVDLEVKVEGSTAMLSWSEPQSSELPGTYNLRVGTAPLGVDLVSPMADPVTGMRYISRRGNTGSGTAWTLKGLEPGRYYWSVQALNNAYTASQFSEERVFVVGSEVLAAATATVEIVPSSVVFTKLGETIRRRATAKRANGVIIEHALIVWETADAAVAEVDKQSDGSVVVTAVGSGSTEVIATAGAVSARATVRAPKLVVPPPPPVGPPLTEREALTALYNATGDPDWVNNTKWLSDRPLGEWHGVHTNNEGRIIGLQLESNGLSGALPPEIRFFTELTWLSVVDNSQLTGPIPPEIGYLTALQSVTLVFNNLSGSIPREIGNLTNITLLLIASSLSGPIPAEIGNLAALQFLGLYSNRLSGPVPLEIGNLTALKVLNLSGSGMTGPLPNELLNLQLTTFNWGRTHDDLCMPATDAFAQWAEQIAELQGPWCNRLDHDILQAIYELAGGDGWTNQSGWPDDPVLSNRYGISTNASHQVVAIDLSSNELAGQLTHDLTRLVDLRVLKIGGNPELTGRIPYTFPSFSDLQEFRYAGTGLCVPQGNFVRNWLSTVPVHEGTGADCPPSEDREVLVQLYEAWSERIRPVKYIINEGTYSLN